MIGLFGCVTSDRSGAAVIAQWNARFNARHSDAADAATCGEGFLGR